jgi:hypothetical protein
MPHKQPAGGMTLHPPGSNDHTAMVEEDSVFQPTERSHG